MLVFYKKNHLSQWDSPNKHCPPIPEMHCTDPVNNIVESFVYFNVNWHSLSLFNSIYNPNIHYCIIMLCEMYHTVPQFGVGSYLQRKCYRGARFPAVCVKSSCLSCYSLHALKEYGIHAVCCVQRLNNLNCHISAGYRT